VPHPRTTVTTTPERIRIDTAPTADSCRVAKVDSTLGLIIGYGAVCKEMGEDYYDEHKDHLPEDEMVKATVGFMEGSRSAKIMHAGEKVGRVVCAFPMSTDIAAALKMTAERTGVVIAWKPDDRSMLAKFESGEWTGFSFGGWATREEVPE
jgi:hypothetical protein